MGRLIKQTPWTNCNDNGTDVPLAKRLKRSQHTDGSITRRTPSSELENQGLPIPTEYITEIPDSDVDEDSKDLISGPPLRPTALESALAPVTTDKEAIAEYEASRLGGDALGLEDRLGQRKWTKGKSSIYVDAFNLALETVLQDEGHLFDETEIEVFQQWRSLEYEAQYLYVRLFLRKTSAWHRINKLGYFNDIADLPKAVQILQNVRPLPASTAPLPVNPGELEPPVGFTLRSEFTFADASSQEITNLEEASSLLSLEELKTLAKEVKVQGKNKIELLKAFRRASRRQSGLDWGLQRTESEETTVSTDSVNEQQGEIGIRESPVRTNRDEHFVRKILHHTGPCIRLSLAPLKVFERVHLVFYRSTEWTENSLTTIILARISRRNFPDYVVSRSANIFKSRAALLEFEASIRTQYRVDSILEFNGNPTKEGLQEVLDIFEEVYPRWKILLREEQLKEDRVYESGEGAYLRRFSPAWVYTRIVHKGVWVLGRFKMHKREHQIHGELLAQHLFHAARRGAWYQRKALLEEHYMAALIPLEGRDTDAQKKHWKRIALRTCEEGLRDKDCHVIYHYDLQKRITKLEKSLKVVKREQHDFSHARLIKPTERTVEGTRIERASTPGSRPNGESTTSGRGAKTIWRDEREGGGEYGVEAMCLSHYRNEGWKGYHAEGGIIRTLFAYLFFDILFTYIPNVFQTAYQICPLDLHTDAFYSSRISEINHRLVEIGNGEAGRLVREVHAHHSQKQTCVIGLDWSYKLDDLLEIVKCFDGVALATICQVMAQEYRQRGGGIPDLFLWHPERQEVMFSEVKSENDRLSDTQRLWIHVLTGAGIKVELCNALARTS